MRWAALPVCLLLGAGVGIATVAVHGRWWGLLLGAAASAATLLALPGRWWARLPFALAWSVAVLVLSVARAEGDYLVASDTAGYLLLLGIPVVLVAGIAALRPPAPQRVAGGRGRLDSGSDPTAS